MTLTDGKIFTHPTAMRFYMLDLPFPTIFFLPPFLFTALKGAHFTTFLSGILCDGIGLMPAQKFLFHDDLVDRAPRKDGQDR
jgi:hypothetical protein